MKKDNQFSRLYVHVPFCAAKCHYCAFYSLPEADDSLVESYLTKLENDFSENAGKRKELQSIYIGGGTPTWLNQDQLERLLNLIGKHFSFNPDTEFSIECNPETLDPEKAALLGEKVNRVSLGAQSFSPEFRELLGRKGKPESIAKAVEMLRGNGVINLGIDLIYGIPGQSLKGWKQDLGKAIDLEIKHLSAYSLSIDEGSILAGKRNLPVPGDDLAANMWELTGEMLLDAGMPRYEISNYAAPGFECRHNVAIWYGSNYLGCGPAAASFDGKTRWSQISDLKAWLSGTPPETDKITREKRAREILVMGLRTVAGWNRKDFNSVTGCDFMTWERDFSGLIEAGLLEFDNEQLLPTSRGLQFWDTIAESILQL